MSEHPRMKLQGRIPVEQLEDERLTNIERKLVVAVSDMRAPASYAPRRLLAFAGMAMAVAVAGFVGYKLRGHGPDASPVVAPGEQDEPQTFALNTDKANTLQLADATLTSGAGTDVVVTRSKHRIVIEMRRGSLDMAVVHDPSRLLVVRAGDTEIEDVGTRFTVDYDGAAQLAVRVTEGEVKVKRAGRHENITAGFAWTRDDGKIALADLAARTEHATQVAVATIPSPTGPTDRGHVATVPHVVDSPVPVTPVTPVTSTTTTPERDNTSPTPATPTHRAGKSNAKLALDKLPIEEPLDVGTKDFNTAIAKYLDLAVSMADSQDKTQVLYSMAVVQHRAHQDKAALYTLSGVIKRQGGKAYKAALWLNVRIECMQRFDDECRQAADLYLRKVPDGVAAGVAQAILTEIQRQ